MTNIKLSQAEETSASITLIQPSEVKAAAVFIRHTPNHGANADIRSGLTHRVVMIVEVAGGFVAVGLIGSWAGRLASGSNPSDAEAIADYLNRSNYRRVTELDLRFVAPDLT